MDAKIKKAGLIVMSAFGLSQLIRLGGNLVTARLLAPDMFGVMAIVYMLNQGIAMFSDLGLWAYIVRNKDYKDTNILNTVWTLQVFRSWLMFATILASALALHIWQKTAGDVTVVYGNKALPMIIAIVGITAVLNGYKTLAPAVLSRELKRGRQELVELMSQVTGIATMVIWAWKAPSIWALVSASLVSSLTSLILNYLMFDLRHKFNWDKERVREIFHFGKWISVSSAITFLAQQSDKMFFSGIMTPAQLGVYSIAFMLAGFITSLIDQFTTKIWLPVLSSARDQPNQIARVYYKIRLRQDFMVSLGVITVGLLAPLLISHLYDNRYTDAKWMMQILLIASIGLSVSSVTKSLLVALGHTKVQMQVMLARVLWLTTLIPFLHTKYGLQGAIYAVALVSYVGIPIQYLTMKKAGVLHLMKEIRIVPLALIIYTTLVLNPYKLYFDFSVCR